MDNDIEHAEEEQAEEQAAENAPEGGAGGAGEGEVTDRHGKPGINRDKYERDVKARDERIAELEARLEEAAKTEEGRAELKEELDKVRSEAADSALTYELRLAGCRDESAVKAAKALLPDHGGDVAKLKEAVPYLFDKAEPKGSTGLKPAGAPDNEAGADRARKALGLKAKNR